MTLIVNETKYNIDFTFALTVTLMLILCSEETVIISLFSSMLHELGHLMLMFLFRQKVISVTFGCFGVRIERQLNHSLSYKKEALIALGGIMVNFVIAGISALCYCVYASDFALKLAAVNIFIALFNMIPVDTLDIGRVLRYTLLCYTDEGKCQRTVNIVSLVFVNLLVAGCIVYCLFLGFNISLIAVTVYLYVITLFKKWS
ncbi:MAG: hypothetical protein J6Q79_08250 [Clostridia bacterium]|nr:hypothetical protein [Clostridia bacterium]